MSSPRIEGDQATCGESPNEAGVDKGRRAAIAKMGGTLAAPAFVMLLTADASEAWSASDKPGKPKPKPPRPPRLIRIIERFF